MNEEFEGFEEPKENWSKLPHDFIKALPLVKSLGELKVILYVLRHTWGYGDKHKRISLDEFMYGRKESKDKRIDNGTGMTINTIKKGIKLAIEHGFLEEVVNDSDKARIKRYYSLKKNRKSGDQLLTVGDQNVIPRGSEVDPRTKKDTIERNLEEREDFLSGESEGENFQQELEIELPKEDDKQSGGKYTLYECLQYFNKPADERLIPDSHATTWMLHHVIGSDPNEDFSRYGRFSKWLRDNNYKHIQTDRTADLIYILYNEDSEWWKYETWNGKKGHTPNEGTIKKTIEFGYKWHKENTIT